MAAATRKQLRTLLVCTGREVRSIDKTQRESQTGEEKGGVLWLE